MTRMLDATVCIAGGGPGGMMLGLLLARAGIDTVVLEKHDDFLRDFRGDTVHPSTLDLIDQLGLRDGFEAIPHHRITTLDVVIDGTRITPVDFRRLPGPNRHVALMPQWDLLDLLARAGRAEASFRLAMRTSATGLLAEEGRVLGVRAEGPDGPVEVRALLTVAADGRHSVLRRAAGLVPREYGVPIDVLWFRLPRPAEDLRDTLGRLTEREFLVTVPRSDSLQCGLLIPKGGFDAVRERGMAALHADVVDAAPELASVVGELTSFDDVKLLTVQVDRLPRWWRRGFVSMGDAAHAMSPAFGVGINYAVQDAVAAFNLLTPALRRGEVPDAALAALQRRRLPPVSRIQPIQLALHRRIARPGGGEILHRPPTLPERAAIAAVVPVARSLSARVVGRGFRPERIDERLLS